MDTAYEAVDSMEGTTDSALLSHWMETVKCPYEGKQTILLALQNIFQRVIRSLIVFVFFYFFLQKMRTNWIHI